MTKEELEPTLALKDGEVNLGVKTTQQNHYDDHTRKLIIFI